MGMLRQRCADWIRAQTPPLGTDINSGSMTLGRLGFRRAGVVRFTKKITSNSSGTTSSKYVLDGSSPL